MGLESSIFMTRAVLLSLLLHVFVLFVMSHFLTLNPPAEVFTKINVYFTNPDTKSSGSETDYTAVPKVSDNEKPRESESNTVKQTVKDELPVVEKVISKIEDVPAEQLIEIPLTEAVVESQIDTVSESVEDSSLTRVLVTDGKPGTKPETPGNSPEKTVGSGEKADLEWEGGAAVPRTIPEPDFTLPYNAILPDVILVSFRVQSDGTVRSIRILAPGSGHVNLDQQIRAYVNSLVFEPFAVTDEEKKGRLRLNLKERGGGRS